MRKLLVVSTALLALMVALHAQQTTTDGGGIPQVNVGGTPRIAPADAVKPVPRLPDGTVDLTGPWLAGGSNADIEREGGLKPGGLPLLPWAKKLRDSRRAQDEPYTACLPMSVPRMNPYPWKFAMSYTAKGLSHIYVLHETGDAGAHRVIYMDGRGHPAEPIPTWWGHSIGWWEGDTLVVDTVGYNDKFWFDSRGTPHTDQLHTIERWTRLNFGTMVDEFTLDDPGAFSRPVYLNFTATHIRADIPDLMEFICLEDNEYGQAGGFKPGQDGK
ncbi:MAG: hypothetical protein HY824_14420 [Acidobacteria bacterium]|nr:hypothetical protein [Acidobacteriota bacterium]